jgi:ketosteroid isomerase-like protein
MSEESTTPDLVERMRLMFEAADRADWEGVLRFVAPEAVWEATGLGTSFDGVAAIRVFLEEWSGPYEDWGLDVEEILDLGDGVTFAVFVQKGHPVGSTGQVQWRHAQVGEWAEGVVVRITVYADIDEARAAAERLAESRG